MENTLEIIQTILVLVVLYVLAVKSGITKPSRNGRKIVLDTSALIDGRIIEVTKAGFVPQQLIIPRFILNELQLLADGQDTYKRERARYGLDMVQVLQNTKMTKVTITNLDPDPSVATDDKLVLLAKKLSADLCTTDYNLNKVATIVGVRVLNVNELSHALRPVALPGEKKRIKIIQKGSNKDQGVGYTEDGSMVVVESAARYIGKEIDIEINRFIQTDAGKMLFAKIVKAASSKNVRSYNKKER